MTMMDAIAAVLDANDVAAFDGGALSGWMGTLNDWFADVGFNNITVADETPPTCRSSSAWCRTLNPWSTGLIGLKYVILW
jgi:hypothetical protein